MTAPNGPSQQACILQSMREVSTSASSFQVNCSVQFTGFTRETMWPFGWQKSPSRPETRQEISIWQNAMAQVGCVFFSSHSLRSQFFKNKSYGNNWGPKNTRPFNLSLPWGTALGDPIEVGALKNVMEPRDTTLALTSSKSNIGHLEGSAGASQFLWLGNENWRSIFPKEECRIPWIWGWNCRLPEVRGEPKGRGISLSFQSNCWDANGVRCLRFLC